MAKKQFSVWIEEKFCTEFDDFFTKNKKLFPKQGGLAKAAELVIETGIKTCQQEIKKINTENKSWQQ